MTQGRTTAATRVTTTTAEIVDATITAVVIMTGIGMMIVTATATVPTVAVAAVVVVVVVVGTGTKIGGIRLGFYHSILRLCLLFVGKGVLAPSEKPEDTDRRLCPSHFCPSNFRVATSFFLSFLCPSLVYLCQGGIKVLLFCNTWILAIWIL